MLFNSIRFIIFFPIVVALYFSLPQKFRWIMLLAASYYFYMCWNPEYIILIIVSTLIDYFAAIMMERHPEKEKRLKYLIASLVSNMGILFFFKYFNFFSDSVKNMMNLYNIFYEMPHFNVLLPVGISFYTFQTLSYSIDVYKGNKKAERHLGIFALYVAFFPQLVAGPIERATHLLPQFFVKHSFEYARFVSGARMMVWGFFKKMVIADQLAIYVDAVYNNGPGSCHGLPLLIATYFFAIQIYCDFSGYSDIAIGTARILGYDLMYNFNTPYIAKSIREFWSRWHISLTTWFRDYLYIPMGGGRVGPVARLFNVTLVFLVSALWHGANWTFVIWGVVHAAYYIIGSLTAKVRMKAAGLLRLEKFPRLKSIISIVITFNLVSFAWIFFRAESTSKAFEIVRNIFSPEMLNELKLSDGLSAALARCDICNWGFSLHSAGIALALAVFLIFDRMDINSVIGKRSGFFKLAWLYAMLLFILVMGSRNQTAFIYFQF